jgi:hypothetical protein
MEVEWAAQVTKPSSDRQAQHVKSPRHPTPTDGLRQWFVAGCGLCRRPKLFPFRSVVMRCPDQTCNTRREAQILPFGDRGSHHRPKKKAPAEAGAKFREETPKKCVCVMNRANATIHDALHNMRNREFVSSPSNVKALLQWLTAHVGAGKSVWCGQPCCIAI